MTSPGALPTEEEIAEIGQRAFEAHALGRTIRENWLKAAKAILARLRPAWERTRAEGFKVEVADVTNDAATLAECGRLKAERDALRAECERWASGQVVRDMALEITTLRANLANRHYVCEAHVPLGEPDNHDDKCPCCEAMKLADDLRACAEALPENRSRRFNDTTGALGYWTKQGATGANLHPDRCVCQGNDTTPHKHYPEHPFSCARCLECKGYVAALARPGVKEEGKK